MELKREPAVAGLFYEDKPNALISQIRALFNDAIAPSANEKIRALILPHAGYIFSGKVAASGVNQIIAETKYDNIFLIGSSHRMGFDGASVFKGSHFNTPLGSVEVNYELVQQLTLNSKYFSFSQLPHEREHSLEVQLPILQYHFRDNFKIVPILIGTKDETACKEIAKILKPYFHQNNLFIISTDFSHYPSYKNAIKTDKLTAKAILSNQPKLLTNTLAELKEQNIEGLTTPLCGWPSVLTLMYITHKNEAVTYRHVQYENSGDSPVGDRSGVVGYHSIVVCEPNDLPIHLTESDKATLLNIALKSIMYSIKAENSTNTKTEIPESLKTKTGAFVSIYINGELNGCIGHIGNDYALWENVERCAKSAATEDNRFKPLREEDLSGLSIEISILTPLKRVNNIDEINPGQHGILIRKGLQQGTFLPKVAKRMNWSTLEMLEHCAQDKAKIGKNGWRNAEIYTYEAIVVN